MGTLSLDTLKLARKLQAGGFTVQQAETAAAAIAESLSEVAESLPTRSDLKGEFADVKGEIAEVRRDAKDAELRLEARISEAELRLETKIADNKAEILKWMYGAMAAQTALIVGLLKLLP